jgi:hypothetical protein
MSSESDAFNHTAKETYRAGTMACEYTAGTAQSEKGSWVEGGYQAKGWHMTRTQAPKYNGNALAVM